MYHKEVLMVETRRFQNTYFIRNKIPKAIQSKDTEEPNDHVLNPLLMLSQQLNSKTQEM